MDMSTATRLIAALRDVGVTSTHLDAAATLAAAPPYPDALAYVDDDARAARFTAAAERGPAAMLAEITTIHALNGITGAEARNYLEQWHGATIVAAVNRAVPAAVKALAARLDAAKTAVSAAEDDLPGVGLDRPRWADQNGYPHAADGHNGHTITARTLRGDAARVGPVALAAFLRWEAATSAYERLVGIVDMLRAGGDLDNAHPLVRARFRLPTAPPNPELARAAKREAADRTENPDGTPGRPYVYAGIR